MSQILKVLVITYIFKENIATFQIIGFVLENTSHNLFQNTEVHLKC